MRKFFSVVFLSMVFLPVFSQGKPLTEIFADFHYNITSDTSSSLRNGFDLKRAFLGYVFQPANNITATVIVNVGSPSDLYPGSKERRYAHFREASVAWNNERLTMSFGMTPTRSLNFQQKFYGKRYIADNFEAINGFSTVADLGFSADYIINDALKVDVTLMNGEGYNNLNIDNSIKSSIGVTLIPVEKSVIRLYADFHRPARVWQQLYIGFLGFKSNLLTIGGEVAYKTNADKIPGHNAWGFSATGSVKTSEKTEIFGRYDYSISNIEHNEIRSWNYTSDRQCFIGGVQYTFNEYFRLALDYQGSFPMYKGINASNAVFMNAHFKF